jgi:hypothetical protein
VYYLEFSRRQIMELVFYSKPGCHLCEGLLSKLQEIQTLDLQIEIRDITTRPDWWQAYEYEIPVLYFKHENGQTRLPRLAPRAPVSQLEKMLKQYLLSVTGSDR